MNSRTSSRAPGRIRLVTILAAVALLLPLAVVAAGGTHEGVVNAPDGLAIRGYDPVAYFTLGEAVPGDPAYRYEWEDAEWRFVSAEHLRMFREDPERYAPSYGGYCAYAAAKNQVADGDPELWLIHDGRLFLNLNRRVDSRFREDPDSYVRQADGHWPGLRSGLGDASD